MIALFLFFVNRLNKKNLSLQLLFSLSLRGFIRSRGNLNYRLLRFFVKPRNDGKKYVIARLTLWALALPKQSTQNRLPRIRSHTLCAFRQ